MSQITRVSFACTISLVCVLLTNGSASITQLTDESADKDVLVTLYHALKGESWQNNEGWLSDAPIGEWHGVTVHEDRVVELTLSYNQLSGDLPNELARLTHLETLDLRWNALTGHLPNLGDLREVRSLLLTDNKFSGPLPTWIGDLETLERLDFSLNQFEGEIPAEVGKLKALQSLAIHHNNLSGAIPREIADVHALRRLILNDNTLTGALPEAFGSLNSLRHLNLSNNDLSGVVPTRISSSQNMEWLDLRDNAFDQDDALVLHQALPNFDEYWGEEESSGEESTQEDSSRQMDPIVLNVWAQTSEVFEEPASRAFIFESLKPLEVRDGILHISEDRMPELVRESDLLWRVALVNEYLKESNILITSANDLERVFKGIEKEYSEPLTSIIPDDSDESLEKFLRQGGTTIGNVRLSSWYPSRDEHNIIHTKSKYDLITSYQDTDIQVDLEFRLFKMSTGLFSSLPEQKVLQPPPMFPHDQDFTVPIRMVCENGWYYTVFRVRFVSDSGGVTPDQLVLKTRRVLVNGCW